MKNKKQKPNTHLTGQLCALAMIADDEGLHDAAGLVRAIVRKRRTPKSRAAVRQSSHCVATGWGRDG